MHINAGSRQAIFYAVCQVADEIWHAMPILNDTGWAYRFCQWCHRYDADNLALRAYIREKTVMREVLRTGFGYVAQQVVDKLDDIQAEAP